MLTKSYYYRLNSKTTVQYLWSTIRKIYSNHMINHYNKFFYELKKSAFPQQKTISKRIKFLESSDKEKLFIVFNELKNLLMRKNLKSNKFLLTGKRLSFINLRKVWNILSQENEIANGLKKKYVHKIFQNFVWRSKKAFEIWKTRARDEKR